MRADAPPSGADPVAEPLPESLRLQLDRRAEDWVHECASRRRAAGRLPALSSIAPLFAVTVVVALIVVVAWPQFAQLGSIVAQSGGYAQWRAQRERAAMMRSAGVEHWTWGGAAEQGAGDVVWDSRRQRGYLLLRGYPPNDPARVRYQAWILDATPGERRPVHGGSFDVPAGVDEVVIPIRANLPVERAAAFAVTIGHPDGMGPPDRTNTVALARPGD